MAWSVIQSAVANSVVTSATTVAVTYSTANLSSGTKLFAVVSAVSTSSTIPTQSSVKDGAGNSFTQQYSASQGSAGSGFYTCGVWAIDTPVGDVGTKPTITFTFTNTGSANEKAGIWIGEVSGLLAGSSGIVDGTAGVLNVSGGHASGSIGPPTYASSAANEFLLYTYADNGIPETMTGPAGYTLDSQGINSSATGDLLVAYKNSTSGTESGAWSASAAYTSGDGGSYVMAAFQLAAGGSTTTPSPIVGPSSAVIQAAYW